MTLDAYSKRIYSDIEALENAAAMIASHLESGADCVPEEMEVAYVKACKKLARKLNNKANQIRRKHGLDPNTYNY